MARINIPRKSAPQPKTHEGGTAARTTDEQSLRRSVLAHFLWEDSFYEDGKEVTKRISEIIPKVDPIKVSNLAIEAREMMKLRHVPLFLVREMAKHDTHKPLVGRTLGRIIQRADELPEFLSIYWKDKKVPLAAQVKKGLAEAFMKFDEYQLSKYNRENTIKLRDVLFLCHAKPKDKSQEKLWKKLVEDKLAVPDTWEVNLSAGKDKKESWERLLKDNKLGGMALLRNLRNMTQAGVNENLVFAALEKMKVERILPFRFISAAKYASHWEDKLEKAMFKCVESVEKLPGKTCLLVDVSGSMSSQISSKSDLNRLDAAAALSILVREICDNVTIYKFDDDVYDVKPRRGFALRDEIGGPRGWTQIGKAVAHANKNCKYDRIIVFTDEQSGDKVGNPLPGTRAYMVNVATNKYGVGYGKWTHIDGFSESVITWMREYEKL